MGLLRKKPANKKMEQAVNQHLDLIATHINGGNLMRAGSYATKLKRFAKKGMLNSEHIQEAIELERLAGNAGRNFSAVQDVLSGAVMEYAKNSGNGLGEHFGTVLNRMKELHNEEHDNENYGRIISQYTVALHRHAEAVGLTDEEENAVREMIDGLKSDEEYLMRNLPRIIEANGPHEK